MTGTCQCGATVQFEREGGVLKFVNHACRREGPPVVKVGGEWVGEVAPAPAAKPWSAAKPTDCSRGHHHGSKREARLCEHVHSVAVPEERVYVHARIPLFALGPDSATGRPSSYFTPDFLIIGPSPEGRPAIRRCLDAKGRQSREWRRGKAAFEEGTGITVEEVR